MKREKFAESRERILYAAAARKGGYGWMISSLVRPTM